MKEIMEPEERQHMENRYWKFIFRMMRDYEEEHRRKLF
jgi:hypothetical protein